MWTNTSKTKQAGRKVALVVWRQWSFHHFSVFFSPLKCKVWCKDVMLTFPYRISKIMHLFRYLHYYSNGVLLQRLSLSYFRKCSILKEGILCDRQWKGWENRKENLIFYGLSNLVLLTIVLVLDFVIMFMAMHNNVLSNNVTILVCVIFNIFLRVLWDPQFIFVFI